MVVEVAAVLNETDPYTDGVREATITDNAAYLMFNGWVNPRLMIPYNPTKDMYSPIQVNYNDSAVYILVKNAPINTSVLDLEITTIFATQPKGPLKNVIRAMPTGTNTGTVAFLENMEGKHPITKYLTAEHLQ